MKSLNLKKVAAPVGVKAAEVPAVLDENNVVWNEISCVNWKDYPYQPAVRFRAAHVGEAILLQYEVTEKSVRAVAAEDNGHVWEDACAEFFIQMPGDAPENYYNLECNCGGTLLIGYGKRGDRVHGEEKALKSVGRWSSLGKAPFEEKMGEITWQLALVVPAEAFFAHQLKGFDGMTARGNFYKCGDCLQTPHFLSWAPIDMPKPCFHCPDFFGTLNFE